MALFKPIIIDKTIHVDLGLYHICRDNKSVFLRYFVKAGI